MPDNSGFGPHLMVDMNDCDPLKLADLNLVFDVLNELPDLIGMTKITQPYVFKYQGKVPEDLGITGFVVIAESHLSIHTFQDKSYCFADVFSCRHFDYKAAERFLVESFGCRRPESKVAFRGAEFPR